MLSFVLIALLSGMSLSVSSGSIISSRIVSRNTGILIAIAGDIAGLVLQGNLLSKGVQAILPVSSPSIISIALAISTIIFIIGYKMRVPQSVSITFTMALTGIALATGIAINARFLALIIGFWVAAPLVSVVLTMFSLRAVTGSIGKKHVWPLLRNVKVTLIVVSFLCSATLGANSIGLVYASVSEYTNIWVLVIAIMLGSFLLSSGSLKRLGEQILPLRYINALVSQTISVVLVEIATLASLPFSNTQAFTASLYGAALSYKTKLLLRKNTLTIIFSWLVTAVMSLALGYLLTLLL